MATKDIKGKITEYFFLNPTARLRVRQIEREVEVALPSAIRYAKELEQEGILKLTKIAGVNLYSADRSSREFLLEKKLFNLKQISPLVDYLIEHWSNPTIVIFGSYARGEDVEGSDVDIYLQTSAKKVDLKNFEKQLSRGIQLFIHRNIHQVKNKELANNIINGVTLNGFIEVFK
jgi:predicted nucleotidyltransferase